MSIKIVFTKITNPLILTYELIISNRRLILPTMVGLIIALTVISETNVMIDSYRQEIFEEMIFNQNDKYDGDIEINMENYRETQDSEDMASFYTNFYIYSTIFNQTAELYDYKDRILETQWYSSQTVRYRTKYETEDYVTWDDASLNLYCSGASEFYSKILPFLEGSLPENSSEVIICRPEGNPTNKWDIKYEKQFKNFTLNNQVNISLRNYGGPSVNKTVTIKGIITYPREENTQILEDSGELDDSSISSINSTNGLLRKYLGFPRFSLITEPLLFKQMILDLSEGLEEPGWDGRAKGKVFFDHSEMDAYSVGQEMTSLRKFLQGLEEAFNSGRYFSYIYSSVYNNMQYYQMAISTLTIMLLLVSFPVIAIALYLVIYSFGLIRRQKQDQIGILKTRGGSTFQIFTVLIGEMIISTLIAVAAGFVISVFFADLVMRSSDFLDFLGTPVPVKASVNSLQSLVMLGLILSLLLNFVRIFRMSRQQIMETIVPTEKRPPLWKRYYFDVIMFVIGTATWFILLTMINMPYTEEPMAAYYILAPLISLLGIPAPFMMFFGSIMVIARLFPYIMKVLSDFLWKVEGGVNAFAIRNVVRHKQSANRAVLLITLALAFSILASSLIFSADETKKSSLYYEYGADIVVSTGQMANDTILSILEENISYISEVSHVYEVRYETRGIFYKSIQCRFIDPSTYAQVGYTDSSFGLSDSLSHLMSAISDNESIVLFKGNMEAEVTNPTIGDTIEFSFQSINYTENVPLKIGGTFKFWPTLYPWGWDEYSRNYWFVGSLGMFENLNASGYIVDRIENNYLVKTTSQDHLEETFLEIQNKTDADVYSPALEYLAYKESFGRSFMLSILNSDLILCAAISVIGVIMFAFFTYVERGKEIGVERALGMTQFQTAQSFLVEALTILSFGTVIGFLTGAYFVTMFLQILQFGESIPPIIVKYPFALLGQLIIAILLAAGIGTVAPAILASRKDISRILKVE
ncbi:MAG: FtsX-like permease family protein [Candidatus Hodarchaeales archaeon]|jgi:ABC-type lipoprotein release transport system permease subunit